VTAIRFLEMTPAVRDLELSQEKRLITYARAEAARFLGYEIVNQDADDKQCRKVKRRCINGVPGLRAPVNVIRKKCAKYTFRNKENEYDRRPVARPALQLSDAAQAPRPDPCGGAFARAWDRRQRRDVQPHQQRADPASSLC